MGPLNIETIEFCNWGPKIGLGRGPDKYQKLINEILLLKYLYAYNSAIKRNERLINNVLGKAWLVVNGVNIWKPHLLRAPRKSSLNIETVEVC